MAIARFEIPPGWKVDAGPDDVGDGDDGERRIGLLPDDDRRLEEPDRSGAPPSRRDVGDELDSRSLPR